jgi:hypothetical protein
VTKAALRRPDKLVNSKLDPFNETPFTKNNIDAGIEEGNKCYKNKDV